MPLSSDGITVDCLNGCTWTRIGPIHAPEPEQIVEHPVTQKIAGLKASVIHAPAPAPAATPVDQDTISRSRSGIIPLLTVSEALDISGEWAVYQGDTPVPDCPPLSITVSGSNWTCSHGFYGTWDSTAVTIADAIEHVGGDCMPLYSGGNVIACGSHADGASGNGYYWKRQTRS